MRPISLDWARPVAPALPAGSPACPPDPPACPASQPAPSPPLLTSPLSRRPRAGFALLHSQRILRHSAAPPPSQEAPQASQAPPRNSWRPLAAAGLHASPAHRAAHAHRVIARRNPAATAPCRSARSGRGRICATTSSGETWPNRRRPSPPAPPASPPRNSATRFSSRRSRNCFSSSVASSRFAVYTISGRGA